MTSPAPANIRKDYLDLPLQSYAVWDSVGLINQTLLDHENGLFRTSSLLCDSMLRDDRIMGVTDTRLNALMGLPRTYEPTDKKKSQGIADDLEDLWEEMFPLDHLSALLKWGIYLGVGLAELRWDTSRRPWMPRLYTWHPQYLYWDWAQRQFYIATQSDSVVPINPGDGKWVLYTPYGYQYGWINGKVRALAQPWIIRKFTYRDWARYCEVHGLPIRKAVAPMDAKQEHKDRFTREMAALGSESVVQLGQNGKDGPNFDLQLLEAQANTYEGFMELLSKVEDSIAINLLGQNLTTEVKGGSFAATKAHDRVRGDVLKFDAKSLGLCLKKQALTPWVRFNYDFNNAEALTPTPRWMTDPPEDKGDKAQGLLFLAQALQTFRNSGITPDVKEILTDFDVPFTGTGIDPTIPVGPQPKPGPGEDDKGPGGKPPPGKRPPKKLGRGVAPYRTAQAYVDGLQTSALDAGQDALAPVLGVILRLVRAAKTPEELKAKLLEQFRGMSVSELGSVLHKATVLARLEGRLAVQEEL